MRLFLFLLLGLTAFYSLPARANEWIDTFHSDITVHADSSLTVTETIRVHAEGLNIKRGIFRDFPTNYKDEHGMMRRVSFQVQSILKDGQSEPYHSENLVGGKRIYIGDADVYLARGFYTYVITYETDRQLRYLDGYDELYWNVTGQEWQFPIQQASATIHLPPGASILQFTGYTGVYGSGTKNFTPTQRTSNTITLTSRGSLRPGEGFTIAVGWPKGFVQVPTQRDTWLAYIKDNELFFGGMGLFLVLFAYYYVVWVSYGKDPRKSTIIPLFTPPKNMSPALCAYIFRMGGTQNRKLFTSAIVNMAVKRFLKIEDEEGGFLSGKKYSITRLSDVRLLSREEEIIAQNLVPATDKHFTFEKSEAGEIRRAMEKFEKSLKEQAEKVFFFKNSFYVYLGFVISLCYALWILIDYGNIGETLFQAFFASLIIMGMLQQIIFGVVGFWNKSGLFARAALSVLALFLILGWLGVMITGAFGIHGMAITVLGVMFLTNGVYSYLMAAPTLEGRKIMDEVEGFKMYLETAEKHQLDAFHPPEMTPEIFEKYLPYAIALDVENKWGQKFENEVSETVRASHTSHWYHRHDGMSGSFNSGALVTGFTTSLASSIASTTSSGSGGGGFSGGGGGGGGGGGW